MMLLDEKYDENICSLDGSPLGSINSKKTSIDKLYNEITKVLPESLAEMRSMSSEDIEIYHLNDSFLNDILENSGVDIGYLYEEYYRNQKFKQKLHLTIRELFFQKIVEYGLSYKHKKSYQFLDNLTFSSDSSFEDENGIYFSVPQPIRLSILLGHRFDGPEYSFKEECSSYISLKKSNLKTFTNVVRMMRYLDRKDGSLYIDYPQYYEELSNGLPLVQPLALSEMHRTYNSDCTYYNNHWVGCEFNKSVHSNSVMAVLSHLKYCLGC